MEPRDTFEGSPWGAEPTEDWSDPAYWATQYRELLAEADPWERDQTIYGDVSLLVWMLTAAEELPRSSPQTLLDAGCGIALIPHLLAFWGFQVTAIDLCPQAIEIGSHHQPTEEELCAYPIYYQIPRPPPGQPPGGPVAYRIGDWLTADLPSFGVICCRNSLRCATKAHWRRSLLRFYDLLVPGGVLLLETHNALGIREEAEVLFDECGFAPWVGEARRDSSAKYWIALWPTG